jgi:hypothetical protein
MVPGDLVVPRKGNSMLRLYKHPGPTNENQGNPITGIVGNKEIGLVLATTVSTGPTVDTWDEVLLLFGEKLGWREAKQFEVLP